MLKYFTITLCTYLATTLAAPGSKPTTVYITTELKSAFKENPTTADIFITLQVSTSPVLTAITNTRFSSRSEKLNALYFSLRIHAKEIQKPILNFLSERQQHHLQTEDQFTFKSFWITNQIYVQNASPSLVSDLATNFSNLILSIDQEFFAELIEPVSIVTNVTLKSQDDELQWGIKKIQAPEAWEQLGGISNAGTGIVVATIDTGVRGTHEALRDNFVGDYGWFDPSTGTPSPTDNYGHGTHTTGTIAGRRGIGVAPQVKWAACRGCPGVFCAQSNLLACGEFFTCPTLPDGSNPDCSKAPNIISNSWGGGRGNTWYNDVIETWHVAGIIPVFSIGNAGPMCSTVSSPGDQNVIAVGSTEDNDAISTFSSKGPTLDGRVKPEVAAPGGEVISAHNTSDISYVSMSGTSMATPHAAGTIALILSRNPLLTYNQVKDLLLGNTDQDVRFSGRECDGIKDNVFPNHMYGSGRINALKSVRAAQMTR